MSGFSLVYLKFFFVVEKCYEVIMREPMNVCVCCIQDNAFYFVWAHKQCPVSGILSFYLGN